MNLQPVHFDKDTGKLQRNNDGVLVDISLGSGINVRSFGAVCDGVTDDTVAVQAAINHCMTFSPPRELFNDGMCKITSSLIYNKAVGTQTGIFNITGGGFVTTSAIALFTSTLPGLSSSLAFNNVHFEGVAGSYVGTTKIIHVQLRNCRLRFMGVLNSTSYAQSWRMTDCFIGGHVGVGFNVVGAYDCHFVSNRMEAGNGPFFKSASGDCAGNSFVSNLYEGNTGPFIEAANIRGLVVTGNYTEGNSTSDYKFLSGDGVDFSGNFMSLTPTNAANSAFWNVVWGADGQSTANVLQSAGVVAGRMHDNSTSTMTSSHDKAGTVLKVPAAGGGGGASGPFTPTWNGGGVINVVDCRWAKSGNVATVSFDMVLPSSVSAATANISFAASGVVGAATQFGGQVFFSNAGATTGVIGGSGLVFGGSGFGVVSDLLGTFKTCAQLSGKRIQGNITLVTT